MALSSAQIMDRALELAGFSSIPEDSCVAVPGDGLSRVLLAIDVTAADIALARHLGCDGVIAHHPVGGAARVFGHEVFRRHTQFMIEAGVPRQRAEEAVEEQLESLSLRSQAANYDQTLRAAELVGMPLLSIHAPCDELGRQVLQAALDEVSARDPDALVEDLVHRLEQLPELGRALTSVSVPVGSPRDRAGKTVVAHGCLTNGGFAVADAYFDHGVGTVVYIHTDASAVQRLRARGNGNLIVTGHIASDWVGLNVFRRALEEEGLEVVALTHLS